MHRVPDAVRSLSWSLSQHVSSSTFGHDEPSLSIWTSNDKAVAVVLDELRSPADGNLFLRAGPCFLLASITSAGGRRCSICRLCSSTACMQRSLTLSLQVEVCQHGCMYSRSMPCNMDATSCCDGALLDLLAAVANVPVPPGGWLAYMSSAMYMCTQ